jgi:hypothetical protein
VNPDQAKQELIGKVTVTNQMVTYAKAYILKKYNSDTRILINSLMEDVEAKKPDEVVTHQSVDTSEMVSEAAKFISWRLAGCEAIWGLIAGNLLIPGSSDHFEESNTICWTAVVPGSGGQSGSWHLEEFSLPVPTRVLMRPSVLDKSDKPLSDPDLYMHEIGIPGIGEDIEASLRESVLWFKNELCLGCLALLGQAFEGAWIELRLALARVVPDGAPIKGLKLQEAMEDQFLGIGKKNRRSVKGI